MELERKHAIIVRGMGECKLWPLSGAADASPFADEAPLPEQVRLHVKPVKPAHVPGWVHAVQDDGAARQLWSDSAPDFCNKKAV